MNDGTIDPPPFPMEENNCEANPDAKPGIYDAKGRRFVGQMTEREMLEEVVESQRKMADLVNNFFDDFKNGRINPMKMMMQGMMGGKK